MAQNTKLTAKQTALLAAIGEGFFGYGDSFMAGEIAGDKGYLVGENRSKVGRVADSLVKKGFLDRVSNEDEIWYSATDEGSAMAYQLAEEGTVQEELDLIGETAPVEEAAAEFGTTEWTEGETEWTRHTFSDGSSTLKRRRQVSGAWRTDYWSTEYAGGKETLTTSRLVKQAIAAGSVNLW